jgi:outer membrane protein OmpA-like peptidoglycan-associated protein
MKLDTSKRLTGQGGVKIHLVSRSNPDVKITIPVFSDGSFFKGGLMPDQYTAFVDTVQLAILNCVSAPGVIDFEVKESSDGDFVSNINFEIAGKTAHAEQLAMNGPSTGISKSGTDSPDIQHITPPDSAIIPSKIETPTADDSTAVTEIEIDKQIVNKIKNPGNKTFTFGGTKSFALSKDAISYLDKLAEYMKANAKTRVTITGHSDNFGTEESNMQISIKRADAVQKYMMKKGIAKTRLLTDGKGALKTGANNSTPEGREKNRRVEIVIIK